MRHRVTGQGLVPAPVVGWVLVGTATLGSLPHLVRYVLAGLPALAEADTLRAQLAPPLFLATVASLALLAARLTWGWPIDRAIAMRWAADGATFVVASSALFILLDAGGGTGRGEWVSHVARRMAGLVWPALTEELAYRGVLAAVVSSALAPLHGDRARAAWTVLACSAAFSFAHEFASTPGALLPTLLRRFVVGLALGALAWRGRSLLPPMFAHAAFNALGSSC